jgi:hypothetical protein
VSPEHCIIEGGSRAVLKFEVHDGATNFKEVLSYFFSLSLPLRLTEEQVLASIGNQG